MPRCCSSEHPMKAWPCWAREDSTEKCRYLFKNTEDDSADSTLPCWTVRAHWLCEIFARNTKISTSAYAICMEIPPSLMHYQTAEERVSAASSAFPLQQCDCEAEYSLQTNTFVWSSSWCECDGWEWIHISHCSCADEQTGTPKESLFNTNPSKINRL